MDSTRVEGLGLALALPSCWLQAVLTVPFPDAQRPGILSIASPALSVSSNASFLPDFAFSDKAPLDLTKEFYPFGQTPGVGSTFYIASQDAFAKPGSTAKLSFNLKPIAAPVSSGNIGMAASGRNCRSTSAVDGTQGFTQNGLISLVVPANVPSGGPTGGVAAWSNVWVRARLTGGGYRGVPSIPSFKIANSNTLAAAVAANSFSIVIDTSNFTVQGKLAQFAGQGQVIQVEGDYSIVTSVSGDTLNLAPALPHAHPKGATVTTVLTTPAATASQKISKGATVLTVSITGPISAQTVVLIDDFWNPEFVTVTKVQQGLDSSGAVLPGVIQLAIAAGCQFDHASGVSLAAVSSMNVLGLADDAWVDTTKEFFPLGKTPGSGDFFLMYTLGGFFATVVGTFSVATSAASATLAATDAATAAASVPASAAATEADKAAISGTLVADKSAGIQSASLFATVNTGVMFQDNAVQQTLASKFTGNFVSVAIGDFSLLSNPFFYSPQLCINVNVTINKNLPPVEIAWEFLDANVWQPIAVPDTDINKFLIDGPGSINLPLGQCALNTVNNQKNYWVRARITSGDYGVPISYVAVDPADPSKGYRVQSGSGNVHPPILTDFSMQYSATRMPPGLVTQNGFLCTDQTAATSGGFAPFVSVTDLTPTSYADPEPAFYLGFDAAFLQQPVKLYMDAAPRSFSGSVLKETSIAPSLLAELPPLRWEYFNGTAWSLLSVLDDTNNLTESGAVEFLTPADLQPLARFDANRRYWIRARSSRNDPFDTQELNGIYLNTTAAIQAVTVGSEILGSSNGQSGQTFRVLRSPVLLGQQVLVHEAEQPSGVEASELLAEEGNDAIQQRVNTVTQQSETWVRWHEVESFLASEPYDRHYTLDHSSGIVTFGDGQRGMIPPIGTHNLAASYQTGGGTAGNVASGTIAQIRSKVPGAGSVTNPVVADGGAETETLALVETRGPQVLRHRGGAVAASDVEWLAREAAGTRVARAKCLSNVNRDLVFEPGWLTLLIVPQSSDGKPSPSSQLLREVEDYLTARCHVGLAQPTPARVNVIGPGYIQVSVEAEVVPQDLDEAQAVKQSVLQALAAYFHPLTGGPAGTGWEFGRSVYASKINQLIENVEGVDHVAALQLFPNLAQHRLTFEAPSIPTLILPEGSRVATPDGRKSAILAEAGDTSTGRLFVKGFKEGDRIAKVVDLKVVSVSGTTIQVSAADGKPFTSDAVGMPRGSVVMMFDGSASTRLASGLLPNQSSVNITLETTMAVTKGDLLTLFYPFPLNVQSVTPDAVNFTVTKRHDL